MWIIWGVILFGVAVLLLYAYLPDPAANQWKVSFEFAIALVLMSALPISLRIFVVPRIKNPWLVFLLFLFGIFLGDMISVMGMFALRGGQQSYILVGMFVLLFYCPHWLTRHLGGSEVDDRRQEVES